MRQQTGIVIAIVVVMFVGVSLFAWMGAGVRRPLRDQEARLSDAESQAEANQAALSALEDRLAQQDDRLARMERETDARIVALNRQVRAAEERVESDLAALRSEARDDLARELDRLKERQNEMEAFWAERGEMMEPIPEATLTEGCAIDLLNPRDNLLPMEPVEGTVIALEEGGIRLAGGAHLRSLAPAAPLTVPLVAGGDMSLEVVLKPANLTQEGPARIVSVSKDTGVRNFTLGQEGSRLVMRFRTTDTGNQGTDPHVETEEGVLTGERQTILFTREGRMHRLYVDGEPVAETEVPGDLSVWDHSFPLLIGNEATRDRTWEGEVYRVVFYNRAVLPGTP